MGKLFLIVVLIIGSFIGQCDAEININNNDTIFIKKSNRITCEESYDSTSGTSDPVITRICTFRNFETISVGTPDNEGRYSWERQLYQFQNGKYLKTPNADIFNTNLNQLLPIIYTK